MWSKYILTKPQSPVGNWVLDLKRILQAVRFSFGEEAVDFSHCLSYPDKGSSYFDIKGTFVTSFGRHIRRGMRFLGRRAIFRRGCKFGLHRFLGDIYRPVL
jgi:hypothetical protein